MPAEADLFSLEESVSSQNFKAVVCNVGFFFHKIFDVIEVLVYLIEAIGSCFKFCWALEVA
jgi:hypothetical protein